MKWPDQQRWQALWRSLSPVQAPAEWYERLANAYAEPGRHYHNQQHIAECLAELDQVRDLARQPAIVELALWFHDAIYDPKAGDNEERSAALAGECVADAGLDETISGMATNLIMATKTHVVTVNTDGAVMVDVDLSILGRDEKRFFEYEEQIRHEYAWVPELVFAEKRAEILQRFLDRDRIFATERFVKKYERQARLNLAESIRRLRRVVS